VREERWRGGGEKVGRKGDGIAGKGVWGGRGKGGGGRRGRKGAGTECLDVLISCIIMEPRLLPVAILHAGFATRLQ
jgi:hypothetical protein